MKLLFAFILTSLAHSKPIWYTDFSKACSEAKTSDRLVLLNFSGDGSCSACIDWGKHIFLTDSFRNFASKHLVLVNADYTQLKGNNINDRQFKQYTRLVNKYNPGRQLPYTLLLNADGSQIEQWMLSQEFSKEKFTSQLSEKAFAYSVHLP